MVISMIPVSCWPGPSPTYPTSPILPHSDSSDEREFQQVYQNLNAKPSIYLGTSAPNYAPLKSGDMYVDTSAGHVYIATGTATSGSWAKVF